MRKFKKTFILLVAVLTLSSLLLTSCGTSSGGQASPSTEATPQESQTSSGPKKGGDLVIALNYEPDTMNVYSTHLMADVQTCVIEGLIIPNDKMEYVPVLAKEVPTLENGLIKLSEDGKKMDITYNLQPNVKWSDGQPFTSADVKATWEALKNPAWEAEGKDGVFDIDSIDTPDDLTVICHYNKVVADFASTLFTFGIMPKHIIEGQDLNQQKGYNREQFIGTGPYKLAEWKDGEYIKLVRNENYWREGAWLDSITFKFVPDMNTQITQLKTGEVQWAMGLPIDSYNTLKAIPDYTTIAAKLNAWAHIDFNFKNDILGKNLEVRQAINMCLDKETIVKELLQGLCDIADSPWMNFDVYHNANLPKHEYNIDKAKELLESHGWKVGADGIREKDGKRLSFQLLGRTNVIEENRLVQVFQEACKEAGIELNIELIANSAMSARRAEGQYDLKIHRWITGSESRTMFYSNKAFMPNGVNDIFYDNQELTDLLELSDSQLDPVKRKEMLDKVQVMLIDDMVSIPVFDYSQLVCYTNRLKGFVPNPTNLTHFWSVKDWYLE